MSNITVEAATEILEVLGCEHHPMYRHGKPTTAKKLCKTLHSCRAEQVWVEYHVGGAKKKRGTFYSMMLERIRTT